MMVKKILVVGQTPPPYGGQAVMIKKMLEGEYPGIRLYHVRMNFSKELDEAGKFNFRKLVELVRVILFIVWMRLRYRPTILYYPPSGPTFFPALRDIVILITTRWMFDKTVFHFHAGDLSGIYKRLPIPLRVLFKLAFYQPDVAIRLSILSPADGEFLLSKKEYIVPNGLEDIAGVYSSQSRKSSDNSCPKILFVGVLSEAKGIMVLLAASNILLKRGLRFQLNLVGKFESLSFQKAVESFASHNGLGQYTHYLGVLIGSAKHNAYASADIFAFPTFAPFETFGLVLLEAMSFSLPVVASAWRGIPDIVDETCGFLVPPGDPLTLAEKLELLIRDAELRIQMGSNGRKKFLEHFTIDKFCGRINRLFQEL